jgi:hypothetical protein
VASGLIRPLITEGQPEDPGWPPVLLWRHTVNATKMSKLGLIRALAYMDRGTSFLANVIETGCRNPYKKLAGLYQLVTTGHCVICLQGDMSRLLLDGVKVIEYADLENVSTLKLEAQND